MQYGKLGKTGLDVSPICIGAMSYGEPEQGHPYWSLPEAESRDMIRHALDHGINFFDTANMYSQGSSEEILGRALKDFANRDDVVVCTKVRHQMRAGPNGSGLSRKAIMAEIDHSLMRLGMDYVDIYMIHRADPLTPWEETLEALNDVVKAGKARYLGASSMKAWEFSKALHLQKENGWARFVTLQNHYNLVAREEDKEMHPVCADWGVGTMIWSPLARGRLSRPWGETTTRSAKDPYQDMLYAGTEDETVVQESVFTRRGVDRILRYAFELAQSRPARHLTSATKSNGIVHTMPFWDERFKAVAADYPDVKTDQFHIDILTAHFVQHPDWFDVVVGSNLFGDILSDLGPAVAGSIGIAPSANINPERDFPSMFEPVHGSAPDIAGQGIANPVAAVWSAAMMMEFLGETQAADAMVAAIETVLAHEATRTRDLGGRASTQECGRAIADALS